MDATVRVTIPYHPRGIFDAFHKRSQRWSATVAHRRAGKTVARINELVKQALLCPRVEPRYAYVAPTFAQAKDVAWSYLCRYTAPIPGAIPYVNELRVDLPNGGRVRLYGADNYERMRGIYLDGLVLDEYGLIDPRAWSEVLRPTLADRRGWADFVGTPAGHNHFAEIMAESRTNPDWFTATLKASETKLLPQAELDDAQKTMTPEQYAAEFECSFDAPVVGSYYGRELVRAESDGRICRVPYDSKVPVYTAWDLGIDDSTAIWFVQFVRHEIHVIDYIESNGQPVAWYCNELRQRGYSYDELILPHDAGAREKQTGKTYQDALRDQGFGKTRVLERPANEQGPIEQGRQLLSRCWFDRDKCQRGLEALRNFRRQWDERKKVFSTNSLHDWASHGAKAWGYLAMGLPEPRKPSKIKYPDYGYV